MKVVLAKVNETYFDGEAFSLTAPGVEGEVTILSHHEAFVTTLKPGVVSIKKTREDIGQQFEINGGVLEVRAEGATIIL